MIRQPIVAGQFYEASAERCRRDVQRLLSAASERAPELAGKLVGGIVPHAGWTFSGRVAARVFKALFEGNGIETVVLFGAVHTAVRRPAIFAAGGWRSPLGTVQVNERLAERILAATNLIINNPQAHEYEHSIEVQLPFIQYLLPEARIVPIMVPPDENAASVGEAVGRTITTYNTAACCVGSSDLTHYGPRYQFTPQGVGPQARRWARDVNDRAVIDLICAMQAEQIVPHVWRNHNACGAGAIAAAVAAARVMGAERGVLLEHTTSDEVMREKFGQLDDNVVGYAGIVFG